jgi:hypothetical protein
VILLLGAAAMGRMRRSFSLAMMGRSRHLLAREAAGSPAATHAESGSKDKMHACLF